MVFGDYSGNVETIAHDSIIDKISGDGRLVSGMFVRSIGDHIMDKPPFPYHPLVTEDEVGPERTGEVFADLRHSHGMFLIKEDGGTGFQFSVVEKFTDPTVFNALRFGIRVKLRATVRLARIVSISIL